MMETKSLPHLALERRVLSIAQCPPSSRSKLYPSSSMAAHIFRHPLCINFQLDLNKSLQLALRKLSLQLAPRTIPNLNPNTTGRGQTAMRRRTHEAIWDVIP